MGKLLCEQIYGTFGVEMRAYGQKLVKCCTHTHTSPLPFSKTSRHSKLLFFAKKTKDNGTQKAVQRYGVGKFLCEKNVRDVWCRNESVRAEIGPILQTHTHTHAAKLVIEITETWFKEYIVDESVSLYGYNLERKDRTHGRAGGVACYVRNDVLYKRLDSLEVPELEVIWIKIKPTQLPRKVSCILVACVYYTHHTDYSQMRYHLIMGMIRMIRKHPECGVIITGDFNQLNDNFLKVHYRFVQVVNVVTRGQATLDKIWTNMDGFYSTPVSISELGTLDHCMVLWKPDRGSPDIRGNMTRVTDGSIRKSRIRDGCGFDWMGTTV